MDVLLIVIQILSSIALIVLILMQQGKGAEAGASFGAGASQTFFGSAGSATAITKLTALFAGLFFLASLGLAYVAREEDRTGLSKELSRELAPALNSAGEGVNSDLVPTIDSQPEQDEMNSDLVPIETSAEETQVEETQVEETQVEETQVEETQSAVEFEAAEDITDETEALEY